MTVELRQYPVSFRHPASELVGELTLPPGPGPHAALAWGGEGCGPRERPPWGRELARSGLAVLSWDSPGYGSSAGYRCWRAPQQRALELTAAVDFLAGDGSAGCHRPALVATGLGGWAALLAAGLSSGLRALVLLAPPTDDPFGAELDGLARRMQRDGFIAAEIDLARAVLLARIRRLAAGQHPSDVYAAEAPCRQASWYPWLPGNTPPEFAAFAALATFDPRTVLAAVRCPVLAVFGSVFGTLDGARQQGADVWRQAYRWGRALAAPPGADRHVVVLPGPGGRPVGPEPEPAWVLEERGPRPLRSHGVDLAGVLAGWLGPRLGCRRPVPMPAPGPGAVPGAVLVP